VLEVNPRPTASLETIDAAYGTRSFGAHLEACAGRLPSSGAAPRSGAGTAPRTAAAAPPRTAAGTVPRTAAGTAPRTAAGKAVLYATEDLRVPDTGEWTARGIRDVPHPGEAIAAGHPVCTLIATGRTPEDVLADLEARAAALRDELRVEIDAVA
jgi:predicted ATP-grasp superfamily ATP-dependent carboligase